MDLLADIQDGLGGPPDAIEVNLGSPSDPDTASTLDPVPNPKDDPFIDVVVTNKP